MRIALIGPVYPYRGGIAHYTTMLYRALVEAGHDVLLVSFKRQYPKWLYPGESDKDPSQRGLIVEDAKYWIDTLNPLTWYTTFRRIAQTRPDCIVVQWWTTFLALVWASFGALNRALLHAPLLFICHNVISHEPKPWDRFLTRLALAWGSHFVVQSEAEKTNLISLMPEASASVVPLPVFDMFAGEAIPQSQAREALGFSVNGPILLFFGIVRPYKGLDDLLDALPVVLRELPTLKLVVAGEFWSDERAVREKLTRLEIEDAVIIHNRYIPNEAVPLYFSAADALVAPYRTATGSAVVQLAIGMGCPVIATDIEALRMVIRQGVNGFIVPRADREALATAILRFFDGSIQEPMSTAARVFSSLSRGSWQALVEIVGSQELGVV